MIQRSQTSPGDPFKGALRAGSATERRPAPPLAALCAMLIALCAPGALRAEPTDDAAPGEVVCPVDTAWALGTRLEGLERQILLTQYPEAVEGLRRLQREMTCVGEPPEARQLGRLFLNLGIALNRMGLISDGEAAFATAAGIEPDLPWNEMFAASMGLRYYAISAKVRGAPEIALDPSQTPAGVRFFIDGRRQLEGGEPPRVYPGWHFIQVAQGGVWTGDWYNLQGEVQLDLSLLVARLDGGAPAAVAVAGATEPVGDPALGGGGAKNDPKDDPAMSDPAEDPKKPREVSERQRAFQRGALRYGGALVAGVGIAAFGTSFSTYAKSEEIYAGLPNYYADQFMDPSVEVYWELSDESTAHFEENYLPWVKATRQLRYGGYALMGVGGLAIATSFLLPKEGTIALGAGRSLQVALLPRGAQLSLRF